jgi:hypothetical protein
MSLTCTEFTKPVISRPPKVSTYVGSGPPDISDAPIGAIYIDKDTNNTCMLNPQRKWVQMLTFADFGIDYTEAVEIFSNNRKITTLYSTEHKEKAKCNCRNCGAPVRSCICEYCGTVY